MASTWSRNDDTSGSRSQVARKLNAEIYRMRIDAKVDGVGDKEMPTCRWKRASDELKDFVLRTCEKEFCYEKAEEVLRFVSIGKKHEKKLDTFGRECYGSC